MQPTKNESPSTCKVHVEQAQHTEKDAHVISDTADNVMPEPTENSKTNSGATASPSFTWKWKDSAGSLTTYPDDLNKRIEASYCDNPHGHILFTYLKTQFKIMFHRMAKLDIDTGEKYPVFRR